MALNKRNKISGRQRVSQKRRLLIGAGIGIFILGAGILIYLQISTPEQTAAQKRFIIKSDSLPVDLTIDQTAVDTTAINNKSLNYKVAKPLSLTPKLPTQ
jgi:hypothetical protein